MSAERANEERARGAGQVEGERRGSSVGQGAGRTIHVVTATDRKFIWGCAVTVRSMLDHTRSRRPIAVHVLHDSLRPSDQEKLRVSWQRSDGEPLDISFIRLSEDRVAGLVQSKALSRMTYARLLVAELLHEHIRRCVYLDSDLLFGRDVAELEESDLGGRTLGAVPNGLTAESDRAELQRLGIRAATRYLNAGVLVIDLDRWRGLGVGRAAIATCRERELKIWDQDALNLVLEGDWLELPEHWNSWASRTVDAGNRVVHFAMVPKPWDADYRGPFAREFFACLDRTSFAGLRPPSLFGLAPLVWRLRRRIPYLPTVWRVAKKQLSRSRVG